MFTSSLSYCPVSTYSLSQNGFDPPIELDKTLSPSFQLDENSIRIMNNVQDEKTLSIFIRAETIGGISSFKQIIVNYIKANEAPTFKSLPISKISIEIDEAEQKAGLSEPRYFYTSGSAIDPDGDDIEMMFNGYKMSCDCLIISKVGDSFSIEIDKTKITKNDVGTYFITVTLIDSNFKTTFL